jgi:CubicO group peptidase (beta-lactamase class C family)
MKRKIYLMIGSIIILIVGIGYTYFNYTPSYTSDFKGPVSKDEPLPTSLISDLEKYVKRLMRQNDVSGLSMILVHDDRVIYNHGFGMRDFESKAPVTSQTLFGIASTNKE